MIGVVPGSYLFWYSHAAQTKVKRHDRHREQPPVKRDDGRDQGAGHQARACCSSYRALARAPLPPAQEDLTGRPCLVFPRRRPAVFVHGRSGIGTMDAGLLSRGRDETDMPLPRTAAGSGPMWCTISSRSGRGRGRGGRHAGTTGTWDGRPKGRNRAADAGETGATG